MKRLGLLIIPLAMALGLAACQLEQVGSIQTVPATSIGAKTVIDDKALIVALSSFDMVLSGLDAAVATGLIKPASPKALKIAAMIDNASDALQIATSAQKAGQAKTFEEAISRAMEAISGAQKLLGEKP